VVLGAGGVADHAFRGIGGDAPGYLMRAQVVRRASAVTVACMLVRHQAFEAVGRFDEAELAVAKGHDGGAAIMPLAGTFIS
jgi:O-antigen biosynthesis protein